MSSARLQGTIRLNLCATYALSRERNEKRIEHHWANDRQELASNYIVHNFLEENIARIFNLEETPTMKGKTSTPVITLPPKDTRGVPGRAYLCEFDGSEKLAILRQVCNATQKHLFERSAERIAKRFEERPFWPKQYLFICQYQIREKQRDDESQQGIAILTTKLARDSLAEDQNKIIVQLEKGVIGRRVKKGILYPHLTEKDGKIVGEERAKVFEQGTNLAKYFYDFLSLRRPANPQDLLNKRYGELCKAGLRSMEQLRAAVGPVVARLGQVRIQIDGFDIQVSLEEMNKKFRISKIGQRIYSLIEGSNVVVQIGSIDASANGGVSILSKQELLEYLSRAQ